MRNISDTYLNQMYLPINFIICVGILKQNLKVLVIGGFGVNNYRVLSYGIVVDIFYFCGCGKFCKFN